MSILLESSEPYGEVYDPDEALASARPLPKRGEWALPDVGDDEWRAFQAALSEL
ncbi:MAG: hypothetical protein ACRDY2_13135 [Acidimicrobiales bacterium]